MRTYLKAVLLFLLVLISTSCNRAEGLSKVPDFVFRNVRWGMNIDSVKAVEKGSLVREIYDKEDIEVCLSAMSETFLEYKGNMSGFDCLIYYGFIDNKLVSAQYHIDTTYSLYVYFELKEILALKNKTLKKEIYVFEEEGGDTYSINRAIFENHKSFLTLTTIYPDDYDNLNFSDDKKSCVNISYESKAHENLIFELKKKNDDYPKQVTKLRLNDAL